MVGNSVIVVIFNRNVIDLSLAIVTRTSRELIVNILCIILYILCIQFTRVRVCLVTQ